MVRSTTILLGQAGVLAALFVCAAPVLARDSLGVFGAWGAFRDANVPRCYAIAAVLPEPRTSSAARNREYAAFASVGTWPRQAARGQVSFHLSRALAPGAMARLAIGDQRFNLSGGGADAWAIDPRMDAAIVAAMRSASGMSVTAIDQAGRRFTDRYDLAGAATAMDAATVACARDRR